MMSGYEEGKECGHETRIDGQNPGEILPSQARTPLSTLTQLQEAASCGDEETTRSLLLAKPVDVDDWDMFSKNETTALYLAAEGGHPAVVNALLSAGADVNGHAGVHEYDGCEPSGVFRTSPDGNWQIETPLHYAALHGHAAVAQALLDAGALRNPLSRVITRYLTGTCTPLHLAVGEGNLDMVRVLLTAGASVNLDAYVDRTCSRGVTPISLAAKEGHAAIVAVLLEAGADVNHQDDEDIAAIHETRDTDILEALLKAGADPNLVVYNDVGRGHTPLGLQILACGYMETSVRTAAFANVQLLLSHGADVNKMTGNYADMSRLPPIMHACTMSISGVCVDLLPVLLEAGADPNPAISSVIKEGRVEVLRLLLRAGVDKNARSDFEKRSTPLHLACRETQVVCVRELLEWGANPDLREEICQETFGTR